MIGVSLDSTNCMDERITLSGSSYLESIHEMVKGRPPKIDLNLEVSVQAFIRDSISKDLLSSAHDVSDGGIAVALAESCITSGLGANIDLPYNDIRLDRLLFAEGGPRILVSIVSEKLAEWKAFLREANALHSGSVPALRLGTVTEKPDLEINYGRTNLVQLSIQKMMDAYEDAIPRRMGDRKN